ncbi:MAG: UbiD family decarboxylase domain-containing protein [Nitrososphaerales archaeon]
MGGWRKEPLELIERETNALPVPANAEIILEAEILSGKRIARILWRKR